MSATIYISSIPLNFKKVVSSHLKKHKDEHNFKSKLVFQILLNLWSLKNVNLYKIKLSRK